MPRFPIGKVMMGMDMFDGPAYWQRVKAISPAPIAYWPLWEASGATMTDLMGLVNGTATNVTLGQAGIGDGHYSASFNGSNSRVNIYSAALNAAFDGGEGTFSIWAKVSAASVWSDGAYRRLFQFSVDANNRVTAYRDGATANRIIFIYSAGGTFLSANIDNLSSTDWMHFLVTWSKTQNLFRVYYNGSANVQKTGLGDWVGNLDSTLCALGSQNSSGAQVWSGTLAHAALWDSQLNPWQVKSLSRLNGFPAFAYAYPDITPCTIPTYDGSNQPTHPDVYDAGIGETWNGKRYWMVMTPYPANNVRLENPSIVVSDDGDTWTVPVGLTNPIEADPGAPNNNADPELIRVGDTLYCFFCQAGKIWYKSSTDGVTWGDKVDSGVASRFSPSIVYDGSVYHMWTVDIPTNFVLYHRTCATITGTWSAEEACTLNNMPSGKGVWHVNMNLRGDIYEAVFSLTDTGSPPSNTIIYFAQSTNGLTWDIGSEILLGIGVTLTWDTGPYRAAMVARSDGDYDCWYASSGSGGWAIGRTIVYIP